MEDDGQCYAEMLLDIPPECEECGDDMIFSYQDGEYHCEDCEVKHMKAKGKE